MIGSVVADVASLTTAVASLVIAVGAWKAKQAIDGVHEEVKTGNGLSMAALADRAEGRRIEADVPSGDRTSSEQHYVEELNRPPERK